MVFSIPPGEVFAPNIFWSLAVSRLWSFLLVKTLSDNIQIDVMHALMLEFLEVVDITRSLEDKGHRPSGMLQYNIIYVEILVVK